MGHLAVCLAHSGPSTDWYAARWLEAAVYLNQRRSPTAKPHYLSSPVVFFALFCPIFPFSRQPGAAAGARTIHTSVLRRDNHPPCALSSMTFESDLSRIPYEHERNRAPRQHAQIKR